MKASFILSLLVLIILASCTQPPDYPIEPVIEFNALSQTSVHQNVEENMSLIINYTDGDGDLGSEDDSLDIFLKDMRLPDVDVPITFKLPFVPEQGTGNGISGEITLKLPVTCCLNIPQPCQPSPASSDILTYEVYIIDRAGNESNRVLTGEITVICD